MKSNDWRHKNVARYTPGNTKILYFFNCLLDGMHTIVNGSYNVKCAGYCDLSYLLNNHSPIAYTCGVYGWNFDVYEVYGVTICTGYRNMPGARLQKISEYEEKARAILNWEDKRPFEEKQIAVENLLKEFCKLNGGVIYE